MSDRADDVRKRMAVFAAREFARHVVTQEGPGEWHCGTPGTGIHHFRVITRPGFVIVFGDIGDWILQHNDRDSLGWLRGAVQSPDYLLGKVRAGKWEQFYPADALVYLEDRIAEEGGDKAAEAVKEALDWADGDFTAHEWFAAWSDAGCSSSDVSECTYPSARGLWLVEALKWLVANLPALAESPSPTSRPQGG